MIPHLILKRKDVYSYKSLQRCIFVLYLSLPDKIQIIVYRYRKNKDAFIKAHDSTSTLLTIHWRDTFCNSFMLMIRNKDFLLYDFVRGLVAGKVKIPSQDTCYCQSVHRKDLHFRFGDGERKSVIYCLNSQTGQFSGTIYDVHLRLRCKKVQMTFTKPISMTNGIKLTGTVTFGIWFVMDKDIVILSSFFGYHKQVKVWLFRATNGYTPEVNTIIPHIKNVIPVISELKTIGAALFFQKNYLIGVYDFHHFDSCVVRKMKNKRKLKEIKPIRHFRTGLQNLAKVLGMDENRNIIFLDPKLKTGLNDRIMKTAGILKYKEFIH